jgi:hypothetical protein
MTGSQVVKVAVKWPMVLAGQQRVRIQRNRPPPFRT